MLARPHTCGRHCMMPAARVQEARIATTLVGMPSVALVRANVHTALQALGMEVNAQEASEAAAFKAVDELLRPVLNLSWRSGLPENN